MTPGSKMRLQLATVALATLAAACVQPETPSTAMGEVRDSASVRIVEFEKLDSSAAPFAVGLEPDFRTGWNESERTFERIEDIKRLSDGRIAVVDGRGTQEIVILASDGGVEEVVGGHGEGPGEFTGAYLLTPLSDGGFVVQDYMESRATHLEDGQVRATYSMPFLDQKALLGVGDEGWVFGPPLLMVRGRRYPDPWRRVALSVAHPPFETEDTIAVLDWDQSLDFNGRDPWAAAGVAAYGRDGVVYGRGDRPELRWFDPTSGLEQIVRWRSEMVPVSDSAWEAFREDYLERVGSAMSPADTRGFVEQMESQHRGTAPYFDQLFVDDYDRVWVGEFVRLDDRVEGRWRRFHILAPDGQSLGSLQIPAKLRIRHITGDQVLGYELGEYGEAAVVAYPIVPTESPGQDP